MHIDTETLCQAVGEKYIQHLETDAMLLNCFIEAHTRAPHGPTVEIGTEAGKTAEMMLKVLESLYSGDFLPPPPLFTVDPYGDRPYMISEREVSQHRYGDRLYTSMKLRLSSYANHGHWCMEGVDFLKHVANKTKFWRAGNAYLITNFTFAFIDGEHSSKTILEEVELMVPLMNPHGIIVVDDCHWDPRTIPGLEKYKPELVSTTMGPSIKAVIDIKKIR